MKLARMEFEGLRALIERVSGIFLADEKLYLVETRLLGLLGELGLDSYGALHDVCMSDPSGELSARVVEAVATHETRWFRSDGPWRVLTDVLLPRVCDELVKRSRSRVKIWSAGCATGQEPYSLAITILDWLDRTRLGIPDDAFEIIATDLCRPALFLARSGHYDSFSMDRGTDARLRARWFHQSDRGWVIDDRARARVQFSRHNLLQHPPSEDAFDLVLCRNVLIYFAPGSREHVIEHLHRALTADGLLLLGESETLREGDGLFALHRLDGHVYYQARETFPELP